MRASPKWMCCWPGLPRLWVCGDWSALALAVAFGGVLNLLLVSACARPDWFPWPLLAAAWSVLLAYWLMAAVRAYRQWAELTSPLQSAEDRGLFLKAQSQYLQGHWFEAEEALSALVRFSHRDVEARLMLATLYRRTRRYDEAIHELSQLERLDGAQKWQSEIAAERRLIGRSRLEGS